MAYNETMNQILLIDKPVGWTSFDVVAKIRGSLRNTNLKKVKVGHAGTLDPFATGLLIILVGDATKQQDVFMKLDKEYEATLKLGFTSTTGDPEGEIIPYLSLPTNQNYKKLIGNPKENMDSCLRRNDKPLQKDIECVLKQFTGEIQQIPPAFSAIKIDGQRAYKLARAGKKVKLEPRKITIYKLEILDYAYPELKIRVNCSSGTYIRTLAVDIGKLLGTAAYLTELRRTKIGDHKIEDAKTVEATITDLSVQKDE